MGWCDLRQANGSDALSGSPPYGPASRVSLRVSVRGSSGPFTPGLPVSELGRVGPATPGERTSGELKSGRSAVRSRPWPRRPLVAPARLRCKLDGAVASIILRGRPPQAPRCGWCRPSVVGFCPGCGWFRSSVGGFVRGRVVPIQRGWGCLGCGWFRPSVGGVVVGVGGFDPVWCGGSVVLVGGAVSSKVAVEWPAAAFV